LGGKDDVSDKKQNWWQQSLQKFKSPLMICKQLTFFGKRITQIILWLYSQNGMDNHSFVGVYKRVGDN
jgi:hypothetical protein